MALNLTTIRNINPTTLTIRKKTALYGFDLRLPFLVSRTGNSSYGSDHDPANHLNPGDQVTFVGILSAQEAGYRHPQVICKSPSGFEFRVHSTDIGRFLGL